MRGYFTADDFDRWFVGRELRRPRFLTPKVDGNSFVLGIGVNGGTQWAFMLELLQVLMQMGVVTTSRDKGKLFYFIGDLSNFKITLAWAERQCRQKLKEAT